MNKILVARLPCGCVASAYFEDNTDKPEDIGKAVLDWLKQGYVVRYEERETISAEKCHNHKRDTK